MEANFIWSWDSLSPVVADSEATLTFDADGKLTGVGTCNEFSGTYQIKGNQITFGPLESESKSCLESEMMMQETTVSDALQGTADFKIEENTLTITTMPSQHDRNRTEFVLVLEAVQNNAGN